MPSTLSWGKLDGQGGRQDPPLVPGVPAGKKGAVGGERRTLPKKSGCVGGLNLCLPVPDDLPRKAVYSARCIKYTKLLL